jgi:sulfate permease, SulP family
MSAGSAIRGWLPIATWLPRYRAHDLRGDGVGALTAWAIVVPESVAYAQIAGVPPQNAFYAAPVALIVYAIFGSSRNLVVGATSAAAILSASTVAAVSSNAQDAIQLSAALAIVAGVILIVAGLLKLGFITNFLAEPALTGFLFGMALIIVVRQLGKIVGVSTGDGDFFARLWHILSHVSDWSATTIVVGVAALVALLALERYVPKLPASLAVLVVGIAVSYLFHLEDHGVDVVGKIPSAVPSVHLPDVSWHQVAQLAGGGFGLALVVFAESYSISSRFARQHGYEVDADQEMISMGAANAAVGLFRGFAVSGSASRTAAVEGAGGSSQMVSLIAAVFVLVTAAFLTPLFTQLPEPVLGAIVVVAVRGFLRWRTMLDYWRRDRRTFAVALTALLGVLVFDLLPGLIIAVALSLVLFVAYASAPQLSVLGRSAGGDYVDVAGRTDVSTVPDVLIVRPDGALFFGNATRVRHGVTDLVAARQPPPRVTCLVLTASYRLSLTVLDVIGELDDDLARHGNELWLVGVPSTARAQLDADPLASRLADGRLWPSVAAAMTHVEGGADPRRSPGA